MNLNLLMEDYKQKSQYNATRTLVEKWGKTGLLEGLETEYETNNMAIMLENQAKRLIDEASQTQTTSGKENWEDIALPLVRRTMGKVVSQDLMSVQPMSMPSGLVFWLEFAYDTTKPTNSSVYTDGNSMFGNPSGSSVAGNLYDWDYTYSKNYVSASSVPCTMTTASLSDFNYDTTISASIATSPTHFKKITISKASLSGSDADAVTGFTVTDSNIDTIYRKYSNYDSSNFYIYASGSDDTTISTVEYVKTTTATNRGDFEAGQTGVASIPEIKIDLRSEAITPTTRKLKAQWTPELAQDLNAYHSIDAEAELANMMSDYMALEIDMENIEMLRQNAVETDYWSAKINKFVNTSGAYVSNAGTFTGTQMEWYQTLIQKIRKVSNKIHKRTLMGGANWIVVGTDVATILESLQRGFTSYDGNVAKDTYNLGIEKIGTLGKELTVYKNPYFRSDEILVGYRGNSFLQTGAVFAPYIPIMSTPTILDPNDFTPRKGMMTRSAKKMIKPYYYGRIICRDLDII